jgi:hypothetical protein
LAITALQERIGERKALLKSISDVEGYFQRPRVIEMKENPKLNCILISKWNEKAKQLWEDRDFPDLFKDG